MKYLLPLLLLVVLASVSFGQETKVQPSGNSLNSHWAKLKYAAGGPRGFTLSGRGMRINPHGQYELWVKVVPSDAQTFTKHYGLPAGTAYVLQYATVDCDKRQLQFEKTSAFDRADKVLEGRVSGIVPSPTRDPVKPGSIGEALFKSVCEDPSLQMSRQ